jgi:hypothetical protein
MSTVPRTVAIQSLTDSVMEPGALPTRRVFATRVVATEPLRRLAATLGLLAGLAAREARAFCRSTTSGRQPIPTVCPDEGTPLRWTSSCAPISIDPSLPPEGPSLTALDDALSQALSRWNTPTCTALPLPDPPPRFTLVPFVPCADGVRFVRGQSHSNTVSLRPRWADSPLFPPGVVAVTIVSFDVRTGAILDADIALNARSDANPDGHRFVLSPSADPAERDLSATLTHELGHLLGFAHSDVEGSVMTARYDALPRGAALHMDDIAGTCAVYPSGSGAAPCTPARDHACASSCQCRAPIGAPCSATPRLVAILAALGTSVIGRRFARSRRRPSHES